MSLQLQLQLLEEFTRSGVQVTLVVCAGSLTGEDGARLRDQLLVVLRHGPRHLLLDLAEATNFDNAAAATLIDTHPPGPRCWLQLRPGGAHRGCRDAAAADRAAPVPGLARHAGTSAGCPGAPDRRAAGELSAVRSAQL